MKKKIKANFKIIIAIVITAIICISTTVYASYKYFAKDIGFTPKNENWQVDNLEDAVNDLYEIKNIDYENGLECVAKNAEASSVVELNDLVIGKYYFCVVQYRNTVDNITVNGADIITKEYNPSFLDGKYATERVLIKVRSNNVEFTVSGSRGINSNCYKLP